ncbi:ATP-binding protein [Candidatus Gottesmanbacteria bacterium]|nr:ATP-binding protein [Candidatus Gottesmanbacteria bacterium]
MKRLNSSEKVLLILGARQVGKTTLIKAIQKRLEKKNETIIYLNCDLEEEKGLINTTSLTPLKKLTSGFKFLFIDEIQRLDNPGLTLKIIYDHLKPVKVLATGSSSFDLKNKLSDALTGRYLDFTLYPLSFAEIINASSFSSHKILRKKQADTLIEDILLYGLYPEIYLQKRPEEKIVFLEKIVESYLFRDILAFQKIRHPQAIKDLTSALSYQIGSEVNENELASRLKIDRKTVVSYLDILEKSYVIFRLFPFSRNPRREIGKKYKIYFLDLGVRNALIGDFNRFSLRRDAGLLWENFLILERLKTYASQGESVKCFFWRSYGGAEVDYLEKHLKDTKLKAFEIKYKRRSLSRGAKIFSQNYNQPVKLITKENYLDFIS